MSDLDSGDVSTFLRDIYTKGKYTDVYFELEYEGSSALFAAHRFVLALRSSYFADEFYLKEKMDNKIVITNVKLEHFKEMLDYMYDIEPCCRKTPAEILEMYKLAEEYQFKPLMSWCHKSLLMTETVVTNVFDILETTEYMQNKYIKERTLDFLHKKTKDVISYYKSEMTSSMISTLLSLKQMSLSSEIDLFNCIFDWAKNVASKNSDDPKLKTREVLEEFLPQLPFVSLSYKQFAELYSNYKDVFNEEEVIGIFMNLAVPGSHKLPDWYNVKCTIEIKKYESCVWRGVIVFR